MFSNSENSARTNEEKGQALHSAATAGDFVTLKKLLDDKGVDPRITENSSGETILFKAIESENAEMVKYICETYTDLMSKPCAVGRHYPLHAAVRSNEDVMRCLVASGIDIKQRDCTGKTVFHEAAVMGSIKIIRAVCEESKRINSVDNLKEVMNMQDHGGRTACHSAAFGGHLDCLKAMVELGFDPFVRSKKGTTILDVVAVKGDLNIIRYVCETFPTLKANRDKRKQNALFSAAYGGSIDCFKCLVEDYGLDMTSRNIYQQTILHTAAFSGSTDIIKFICKRDQTSEIQELMNAQDIYGKTACHSAVDGGQFDCLKALVELGFDPSLKSNQGFTILHTAAHKGLPHFVKFLCKTFPSLMDERNQKGYTVLFSAATGGDIDCFKWLVENYGLDMTSRNIYQNTILHKAAFSGSTDIIKFICKKNQRSEIQELMNARDNNGRTACHSAVQGGQLDCLKALVELGFDPSVRSNKGYTILQEAQQLNNNEIVAYLHETFPKLTL